MTRETEGSSTKGNSPSPPVSLSPTPPVPQSPNAATPRHFAVDVAWTFGARILMTLNSVAAGIIVARWLGAEGVGQLGVITVAVSMVVQLGSAGLPSANTYFVAKDRRLYHPVAVNSLLFALVLGGVLGLGLSLLAEARPYWFGFISPRLIRVAAISIPFQLLTLIGLNIFLAIGNVRRFNLLDLSGQSVVLLNAAVALIILKSDLSVLIALNTAASIIVAVIVVLLIGTYGAKLKDRMQSWRLDLGLLVRMMSYGLKFHLAILAAALMFRADLLLVNHFRGAAEAGVYSIATQLSMLLIMLPGVIATLLMPRVAAEQDVNGEMTSKVSRHAVFIMLIICLVAAPLSFFLPLLYGRGFADVTVQLLVLLPGVYLVGIQSVLAQHFNAMGLPAAVPTFWLVTLLVHIVLLLALVPRLGALGASLASTLSYTMIFALMLLYFRAKTTQSWAAILLLKTRELRDLVSLRPLAFHVREQ